MSVLFKHKICVGESNNDTVSTSRLVDRFKVSFVNINKMYIFCLRALDIKKAKSGSPRPIPSLKIASIQAPPRLYLGLSHPCLIDPVQLSC